MLKFPAHPVDAVPADAPTFISLYSGAGGMDLGFMQAGFRCVFANDMFPEAVVTYNRNLADRHHESILGNLADQKLPAYADVVVGGPPCQAFSDAGARLGLADPRGQEVLRFMDIVESVRPRIFVMENVRALAKNKDFYDLKMLLKTRARELGYTVRLYILNAADYGVAQKRVRMFLTGSLGEPVERPEATHAGRWVTVREALRQLPRYNTPGNNSLIGSRIVACKKPVLRASPYKGSLLFNGRCRVIDIDSVCPTICASGSNHIHIIDQDHLDYGLHPWVLEFHQSRARGLSWDDEIPPRMRRLTVEEQAVLQGFPVSYNFEGATGMRCKQIGNAVPPPMAKAVALSVLKALQAS